MKFEIGEAYTTTCKWIMVVTGHEPKTIATLADFKVVLDALHRYENSLILAKNSGNSLEEILKDQWT